MKALGIGIMIVATVVGMDVALCFAVAWMVRP
jgi:hypothetical protein